jgi:transcription initiation factor TFIID subunit 2
MTIRVYDDEGTPYEQTIDIRETVHRTEISYNNTRRAKRRRKDQHTLTNGDTAPAPEDDILLSLGDVLMSERETKEWKLVEWTQEEEDRIAQEAFEWIRVDADSEWICEVDIGMPEWMFAAQLRQDRDVVAQYEVVSRFWGG